LGLGWVRFGFMHANIITDYGRIAEIARSARRVAVLGMKTEKQAEQAAFRVPAYLVKAGIEVVPVLVYYPDVTETLGRKVYRRVADVPGEIDILDVFRRSEDLLAHVEDIVAKMPRVVWFQAGIRNDVVAERLAEKGILVVQDRCLMIDHRQATLS
jgi:uncharacterized protein